MYMSLLPASGVAASRMPCTAAKCSPRLLARQESGLHTAHRVHCRSDARAQLLKYALQALVLKVGSSPVYVIDVSLDCSCTLYFSFDCFADSCGDGSWL